jgi:exopolysaccharide biosynthesis polyprenyl glycosylphosphotransferase
MDHHTEVQANLKHRSSKLDDRSTHQIQKAKSITTKNGKLRSWPRFPLHISQRKVLLISIDLVLVNAALLLGLLLNLNMPLSYTISALHPAWYVTLTLLWLTIASVNNNYEVKQAAKLYSSIFGIIKTLIITGVIYSFLLFVFPPLLAKPSRGLFVGTLAIAMLVFWRATILVQPNFQRRILIEESGLAGRAIAQAINEQDSCYEIVGYIEGYASEQGHHVKGISILGKWSNLTKFVQDHNVTDIVLTTPNGMKKNKLQAVLKCFEHGVRILPMPVLFEEITGRIPVEHICNSWMNSLPIDWDSSRMYTVVKRAMDFVIACIGLILVTPSFLFLALAIKLDSSGPIFYRPERLGQGGKSFRLWKFRTMVANADRIGDPTFTTRQDQRITRVGRILRRTHLDELPQFINIIVGHMSLIGPRPERYVAELEEQIPYYRTRYAVKPGASGWALVNQGYAEGIDETLIKLQYDLYYIKHQSLSLDILIFCKSILHILTMDGR